VDDADESGGPAPASGERPDDSAARIRLDGFHVMAVDDDADELMLLREVLESAGAKVTTAASGPRALSALEQVTPDVLLTDIGMPGMDGFELIGRIRDSTRRFGSVPAAALTAYARSEDRARAFRSGFQMHLAKPIDPRELLAAVSQLVRKT
jgi:CheY-like chemotaxis protein